MERKIELVNPQDSATELSESRGKGLDAVKMEPAYGVMIVPDTTPTSEYPTGVPVISASDAANGPADFDG